MTINSRIATRLQALFMIVATTAIATPMISDASGDPLRGRILYNANAVGAPTSDVFVKDLTTGEAKLLIADGGSAQWSPDGTQIAYARRVSETELELHVQNSDGSGDQLVYTVISEWSGFHGWTPDGNRLVYARRPAADICEGYIYTIALDGTDEQLFIDPLLLTGDDVSVYGVCFDDSGTSVYWASQSGCWSPTLEIFKADLLDGVPDPLTVVQITDENGVYEDLGPAAHAGGRLALWRTVGADFEASYLEIFVMNEDGSNVVQITSDAERDAHALLSPWGDWVLWASSENGNYDLFAENLDTGERVSVLGGALNEYPLDWVMDSAVPQILVVEDVPNDQGRAVRLNFTRSAHDAMHSSSAIYQYEFYRKIDGSAARPVDVLDLSIRQELARDAGMVSDLSILASGWDYVGSIPAHGEMINNGIAPTLGDSTAVGMHLSTFFVRAATANPLEYYDSPQASGYSVDNITPPTVQNFDLAWSGGVHTLTWDHVQVDDLAFYRIYRDGVLAAETPANGWSESGAPLHAQYEVSAVDDAGNESLRSEPVYPTTGTPAVRNPLALLQNSPNPFNPRTEIAFDVPRGGHVNLRVYDARGRAVRTLAAGLMQAGRHPVVWDGTDDAGREVSSGIYFARLEFGGEARSIRMALVR